MNARTLLLVVLVPFFACGLGSGRPANDSRQVPAFDSVVIAGGLLAEVTAGDAGVRLTADDDVLPDIETFVTDRVLTVRRKPGSLRRSLTPERAAITAPAAVRSIEASGGRNVTLSAPAHETFSAVVSGGAVLEANTLACDTVVVDASGGSTATLQGTTREATLSASGGATVTAVGLAAQVVTVAASGGATLSVQATQAVRGSASGGSTVETSGGGAVEVSVSGGSRVNPRR